MVAFKTESVESWGKHALLVYTDRGWETLCINYMAHLEPMMEMLSRAVPADSPPKTPRTRIKDALENLQIAIRELPCV